MSVSGKEEEGHKRRTSLFHSLKKGMFSGSEKTVDPAFESAKADFLRLNDHCYKIKQAVSSYTAAMKALLLSTKNVCDGFDGAMEDAPKPHAYQAMLKELKTTRLDMVSDRGEGAITLSIDGTVQKKIDAELELHKALIARITVREDLRQETDYYSNKVENLRADRDKRAGKGKEEKPDQIEKFERNTKKFEDVKLSFTSFNELLIADLVERWNVRVRTLGPAMSDFVACERQLLVLYATAVRDVASVEASVANASRYAQEEFGNASRAAKEKAARMGDVAAIGVLEAQNAFAPMAKRANSVSPAAAILSAASSPRSQQQQQQQQPPPPPPQPPASGGAGNPFGHNHHQPSFDFAQDEFKEVGHDDHAASSAAAAHIFKRQNSASATQAVLAAQQGAYVNNSEAWDAQPPMLSHIQSSGMSVSSAVGFSQMNTDGSSGYQGSTVRNVPGGPHSPTPPPPVPQAQPAFYGSASSSSSGSGSLSPPGGPATGSRPRMDSFGALANRPSRGEGEGQPPPPAPAPPKKSFNPFD